MLSGWINPLQILEIDEPWASITKNELNNDTILKFICTPGVACDIESIKKRYKKISNEPHRLFAAPLDNNFLQKIVWPLRHAKSSYILGNYLGTISLCGTIAEMVAIMLFDISDLRINNNKITTNDERLLFGKDFEKLGQERRINILHAYGIIDDNLKKDMILIKNKRNNYLHFWSRDYRDISSDAENVYFLTISIVVKAIGQEINSEGLLCYKHEFLKYIRKNTEESS